jgi:hypothetical protein
MPKKAKPDDQRPPAEVSALALEVMTRMLAMPPKPHQSTLGSAKRSKNSLRKKRP